MAGLEPSLTGPTGGRGRARAASAAALLLVLVGQIWIVSAGHWTHWPQYTQYYSYLADAFLHGQTSLLVRPAPEILASANPYYPGISDQYGLHDAVLFEGKYYLYWGPVPAIFVAAAARIAGVEHPDAGDQYLTWIFLFLTVVFAAVLAWRISARLFPDARAGPAAVMISLGLGSPGLYVLSRAAIYEAAIAAGQCFLLAGLLAAWSAMQRPAGRRQNVLLILTGFCWALSFGSRLSLGPAELAVALILAWRLWRGGRAGGIAGLLLPMAGGAAMLLSYNFVRFHSFTEFGLKYQLVSWNMYNLRNAGTYGLGFIPRNVACYLLAGPYHLSWFPYLIAFGHRDVLGHLFNMPDNLAVEPLVGMVWSQPFLVLGAAALFGWKGTENRQERGWVNCGLCAAALLAIAPVLPMASYSNRYLLDTVPCLTVLACIGYARIVQGRRRRGLSLWPIRSGVIVVLILQSILGILLSINGPSSHFPKFNRPLYDAMQRWFGS